MKQEQTLRRPLQALLIQGEYQRNEVLAGRRNITIREGHRDYIEGPVLIGCHILNWATMRTITSVKHTTLGKVTAKELEDDGFESVSDMFTGMRRYYPDLKLDSPVTVVRWKV